MSYQSRRRNYRSPREKNARNWKHLRLIVLFLLLAAVVWVIKNRHSYWAWLKTYFMD
jgi:hypothetical protein